MGIDFTIIPGKGAKILKPIESKHDILALKPIVDVESQVPFLGPILKVNEKLSMTYNFNLCFFSFYAYHFASHTCPDTAG